MKSKVTLQDRTLKQEFAKMNLILSATADTFTVTALDGIVTFDHGSLSKLVAYLETAQTMWGRNRC